MTGGSSTPLNVTLAAGGTIAGTVSGLAAGTTVVLGGICVNAYEPGVSSFSGYATTATDGTYSIVGLPSGTSSYTVSFSAQCGATPQNYLSQSVTGVTVAGGSSTPVNVTLAAGGTIAGTVSGLAAGTTVVLGGICVNAYDPNNSSFSGYATTATDGTYSIVGLPSGTSSYTVSFSAQCGATPQNYVSQSVTGITVTAGSSTPVNVTLAAGGTIAGTVSGPSGPLGGVCVLVKESAIVGVVGSARTVANGSYTITNLPAGTSYSVWFNAQCGVLPQSYVSQSVTGVTVTAGSTTPVDANLAAGGTIAGTVRGPSGPLGGVCVRVGESGMIGTLSSTRTATDGTYSITGLPAGTSSYSVSFNAQCGATPQNYLSQSVTGVTVTAGSTTPVDANFVAGGSITGTVSGPSGGLGGICVTVYDANGATVANLTTDVNGQFIASDLATGSYAISVNAQCGSSPLNYVNQSMTGVSVVAGSNTSGVLFTLVAGSEISGTVTDASGTNALANICVAANGNGSGVGNNDAVSINNGSYAIVGLPAGTYNVTASANCNGTNQNYVADTQAGILTSAASPATVNFALVTGGEITGVVTGSGGALMANICVSATEQNSVGVVGNAVTAGNGTYTIMGLPNGSYVVEVISQCGSIPLNVTVGALSGVGVVTATTTSGVDFVLSNSTASPPITTPPPLLPVPPSSAPPPTGVPPADLGAPMSTLLTGAGGSLDLSNLSNSSTLTVPAGGLPAGTLLSEFPVVNSSTLAGEVPSGQSLVLSLGVSWVVPNGGVPVATAPLAMTITDAGIVAGDSLYVLAASGFVLVATATTNGSISFSFSANGAFVITSAAAPVAQSAVQLTSVHGVAGRPLTLTASGGAGSGVITYAVLDGTATGCRAVSGQLFATSSGTCLVVATRGASAGFGATSSAQTAVDMGRPAIPASLVVGMTPAQRLLTNHDRAVIASLARKLLAGASVVIYGYAKGDVAVARTRAGAAAAYLVSLVKVHVRLVGVTRFAANEFRLVTTDQ